VRKRWFRVCSTRLELAQSKNFLQRVAKLLQCIKKKYTKPFLKKSMPQIKESLNQKCRDLKKKVGSVKPAATTAVSSRSFVNYGDD
jgi:hypothetical protein